ncbi:hypothetical protein AVEN_118020-1 [Araneus ventricosus]|uniref:Uncharacterized protein n=1 Tax=Araneus ventricosus TaxID=182803 RepID=A0A4Y2C937_ARAVE|nr:hypothetical protein AVEN_118020-1 [Araneus ventricosus]
MLCGSLDHWMSACKLLPPPTSEELCSSVLDAGSGVGQMLCPELLCGGRLFLPFELLVRTEIILPTTPGLKQIVTEFQFFSRFRTPYSRFPVPEGSPRLLRLKNNHQKSRRTPQNLRNAIITCLLDISQEPLCPFTIPNHGTNRKRVILPPNQGHALSGGKVEQENKEEIIGKV